MSRLRRLLICFIIMMLMISIIGCGGEKEEESVSPPDEYTISIEDYAFQPSEITIKRGETITWINKDSVRHNATDDTFDTGLLGKDKSAQQQFDEAGTYNYYCTPHPYMKGTIIVE